MRVNDLKNLTDDEEIVFMTYVGFMSQTLLSGMIEALEQEKEFGDISNNLVHNIFTIFIEMTQNIIKYGKSAFSDGKYKSNGLIIVGKNSLDNYFVYTKNIISGEDMKKITPRLEEIKSMSIEEIKKRYRELRRSARHAHEDGAGIGFYEISKRAESISYSFTKRGEDKYDFHLKVEIKN